jgi:iron only hydrogenase large subunit-like protein
MAQQSGDEFRSVLRRMAAAAAGLPPAPPAEGEDPLPPPPQVCVVSISPQARASLAAKHGLSAAATHKKLVAYFKSLGVHHVVDTSFSRELGLLAAQREFVASFRAAVRTGLSPLIVVQAVESCRRVVVTSLAVFRHA